MRIAAPGRAPCVASADRATALRRVRHPAAPRRAACAASEAAPEAAPLDTVGVVAAWALAPPPPPLLCAADARTLLAARAARAPTAAVSLDLGRSADVTASLTEQGVQLGI